MKMFRIMCFLLTAIVVLAGISRLQFVTAASEMEVSIRVSKREFRLGEIVPVEVGVKNLTKIQLQASINPCILVTPKKENAFKLYAPPANTFASGEFNAPMVLDSQETKWTQESIFWNYKPEVSHLNNRAAQPEIERRILSDYVFSESGTYLIKACSAFLSNGRWKVVESDPVEITVIDPVGEDLKVWGLLRKNANIGYFLQVGDVPRNLQYKTEIRDEFLMEIESVLTKYPNSFYSATLRQKRESFRAKEAQRQEFIRKMQSPSQ